MGYTRKNYGVPTPTSHPRRCKMLYLPLNSRTQVGWMVYVLRAKRSKPNRITAQWRPSAKATSATGFLDLPKEIRDIIYQYISDGLNRVGLAWDPNHSEPVPDPSFRARVSSRTGLPEPEDDVADVGIMRTCQQVHSEFAEVLYASHIQMPFVVTGKYMLPIYATYAHLVKRIFMIFPYVTEQERWAKAIEISHAFLDIFPNITTLKVGWYHSAGPSEVLHRIRDLWEISDRLSVDSHEERVAIFEEFIREKIEEGMVVPRQFRLLQQWRGEHVETAFSEAVRNVQLSVSADQDCGLQDSSTNDKGKKIAGKPGESTLQDTPSREKNKKNKKGTRKPEKGPAVKDAPTKESKKKQTKKSEKTSQPSTRYSLRNRKDHNA